MLQRKVSSLSKMTSQLLMLSRADQGRAKIEQDTVYLSDLALITCEEVKEHASAKNISVFTEIEPDLCIIGDETLLIRFLINLLNNAVTYGKYGGNIWAVSYTHLDVYKRQLLCGNKQFVQFFIPFSV